MRTNKLLAIPFSEKKLKITSVAADLEVKNGETSQVVWKLNWKVNQKSYKLTNPR